MIAGERDPVVLANLVLGRMRPKIAQLEEALAGHFGAHHAFVCRQVIEHIDFLDGSIAALTDEIAARLLPSEAAVTLVCSVTAIGEPAAQAIIAETGVDMSRFPTAGHLCAWAGVAPASYESAGKKRRLTPTPPEQKPKANQHPPWPGGPWHRASMILRDEALQTSEATELSLMPASCRTFSRRWISLARASIWVLR